MKIVIFLISYFVIGGFCRAQVNSSFKKADLNSVEYWDNYIQSGKKKLEYIHSNPQLLEQMKANGKYFEIVRAIENGIEERRKLTEKSNPK